MDSLINSLTDAFAQAQQWLFETAAQPLIYALGLGGLVEDGFTATGWFLVGVLQLIALLAIIAPLQRLRPVESVTDRATIRTDVLYSLARIWFRHAARRWHGDLSSRSMGVWFDRL
jgi:hypothetical protein